MSAFHPSEKSFWLQQICESNFRKLARMVPDLPMLAESAVAQVQGKPSLHLRLLERSPYTLLLELTHDFERDFENRLEPAVRIRVCFDARTAEMLGDACRPGVSEALRHAPGAGAVLDYKWALNYFLARWLDHCLSSDYRFRAVRTERETCTAGI